MTVQISLDDLLFPGVRTEKWQMMPCERIALTGVLSRLRPKLSLEVGVYYGGSLSLTAQYVERVIAIDIEPEVTSRFQVPANADIRIGNSAVLIPQVLEETTRAKAPLSFVLVDGDHSLEGVKRDIELILQYTPIVPMVIMVHDSGNPVCRRGMLAVNYAMNPHVHTVDFDFVPGQLVEHSVVEGVGEIWGGLCIIYLSPAIHGGPPHISEGARTNIKVLHAHLQNRGS